MRSRSTWVACCWTAGADPDSEHKGIIERAHDYFERSFLPGRTFTGPGDFNHQLGKWLAIVNTRKRRVLGCAPTDRIGADRQAMLALPPVAPAVGALRILKRRLSDVVYRAMLTDENQSAPAAA